MIVMLDWNNNGGRDAFVLAMDLMVLDEFEREEQEEPHQREVHDLRSRVEVGGHRRHSGRVHVDGKRDNRVRQDDKHDKSHLPELTLGCYEPV